MAKNLLQNSCDLVPVTPVAATDQIGAPFGLVLVAKQTFTGVSSINFKNLSQYPYTNYKLVGYFLSTINNACYLQVSANNGTSYASSGYTTNTPTTNYTEGSINFDAVTQGLGFVVGNGFQTVLDLTLYNINIPSANTWVTGIAGQGQGSPTVLWMSGTYNTAQQTNAFQLLQGSGTIAGTVSLYGYQ